MPTESDLSLMKALSRNLGETEQFLGCVHDRLQPGRGREYNPPAASLMAPKWSIT